MNVVTAIGNLASDVTVREVSGEHKVASFLLAIDRPSKDGGADFVPVAVWDKQAENCERFLAKGQLVGVDGRLRSRSWEEDGKRRTAIEIVAHRVEFLSKPGERVEAEEVFEAA